METGPDRVNCDKNGYENSFLDILGVLGMSERSFFVMNEKEQKETKAEEERIRENLSLIHI